MVKQGVKGFLLFLFVVAAFSHPLYAGAVFGTVFDSTLEPVAKAVVEAYALPAGALSARTVAQNGAYSLSLGEGNYSIRATILANGSNFSSEENLLVGTGGQKFDLIVFSFDTGESDGDADIAEILSNESIGFGEAESSALEGGNGSQEVLPWLFALALLSGLIFGLLLWKSAQKQKEENPEPRERPPKETVFETKEAAGEIDATSVPALVKRQSLNEKKQETTRLSSQEKLVLQKLKDFGGRVAQRELRKNLDLSEAAVSMAITELEDRGLVEKIRKGRGNIVKML